MKSHPQLNEIDPEGRIICVRCLAWKDPDKFNRASRSKRRYQAWCRECHKTYSASRNAMMTDDDREALNKRRRATYNPVRLKAYREKNYEAIRAMERKSYFAKRYGIDVAEYDRMYRDQQGRCWICHRTYDVLHVDHCHATKKVRGLLCDTCNRGLGFFKDDPQWLQTAADYCQRLKDLHT